MHEYIIYLQEYIDRYVYMYIFLQECIYIHRYDVDLGAIDRWQHGWHTSTVLVARQYRYTSSTAV
jgi:hypothetical protein